MGHCGWAISKSVRGKAKARNPVMGTGAPASPFPPAPPSAAHNPAGGILVLHLTHRMGLGKQKKIHADASFPAKKSSLQAGNSDRGSPE